MLQLAQERCIQHIGFDSEFRFESPPVVFGKNKVFYDPRSVKPLLLSLAMIEAQEMYRFVVDLRSQAVLPALKKLFGLHIPFVGHFLSAELHCMWQLGFREPRTVWDTYVAEKCFYLGLFKSELAFADDANEQLVIQANEEDEEDEKIRYGLVETCKRHGVSYRLAVSKDRLQQSFLRHPEDADFTPEQIDYAAADAEAAAALYEPQHTRAMSEGVLSHLIGIEMPWVAVNARMVWDGVRIDSKARDSVWNRCDSKLDELREELLKLGLENFNSHNQLIEFFKGQRLLDAFKTGNGYSFKKEKLKDLKDSSPAVRLLYEARRVQSLKNDKILDPRLVGVDGRVHAGHRQLGAVSGRQSCELPNLLGMDKTLRPLVIPERGCGIGEADLSQIEVGIAAAVYEDANLVDMFNTDDVYSVMAQSFFHDELAEADRNLSGEEFKAQHRERRAIMKTCTLGIIYGLGPNSLALRLRVSKAEASKLQTRFMAMFPELAQALKDAAYYGGLRGFAVTSTGLRRYSGQNGMPTYKQNNWMRNHPIQGTAADLFKIAGTRLDRLYQKYSAKLLIPFHDAFVFEAPLEHLEEVAELTRRVMCEVVEEHFPNLRPRAEVNITHPQCWNKDGDFNALERWLAVNQN